MARVAIGLVCLALISPGCKCSKKAKARADNTEPAKTEPAKPAELAQPIIELDGKAVDVGPLGDDVELLSLSALPSVESWNTIVATSIDGREFRGNNPKLLTGTRTMKLVKLPAGYEFRVMDVNQEGAYVRHKMSTIARISVFTANYKTSSPLAPQLHLKTGEDEIDLGLSLDEIERSPEPGVKEARDTWKLGDVLGARAAAANSVLLRNPGGQELSLSSAELTDPGWLHLIKRNRRGEFHYRGWKLSEPSDKAAELRGLSIIELR